MLEALLWVSPTFAYLIGPYKFPYQFRAKLIHSTGQEHKGKGVTVQLGPVAGPLGRAPAGGRNWEGFSPDPVLTGIAMAESVKGIQDAGVIACAKHFIGNEQVRFYP